MLLSALPLLAQARGFQGRIFVVFLPFVLSLQFFPFFPGQLHQVSVLILHGARNSALELHALVLVREGAPCALEASALVICSVIRPVSHGVVVFTKIAVPITNRVEVFTKIVVPITNRVVSQLVASQMKGGNAYVA